MVVSFTISDQSAFRGGATACCELWLLKIVVVLVLVLVVVVVVVVVVAAVGFCRF